MLFLLPTFHARLQTCPVSPAALTPHAQGNFCSQCQRVVQDFSQSVDPVADLAAARAASPDGRVCGSFRAAQVQRPRLTRRLRWFVVALVLVVGQGLTVQEAQAQVRRPVSRPHTVAKPKKPAKQTTVPKKAAPIPEPLDEQTTYMGISLPEPTEDIVVVEQQQPPVYTYVEQMPEAPQGGGMAGLVAYIQKQVKWPATCIKDGIEGRIFVNFIVNETGQVTDAKVVKGIHPLLDAETLRVVSGLSGLTPGRQNGRAVKVSLTLPVTWKLQ